MKGKHTSLRTYLPALLYREWLRAKLRRQVRWEPLPAAQPGCTAIIGVCSRLPQALLANLRSLHSARWPELKEVIAVVDGREGALPRAMEQQVHSLYGELNLKFLHYSDAQSRVAEKLQLPYVYSWMSWCIGISHTRTRQLLLHDYDALILGRSLAERYRSFVESKAKVQGITWYHVNGLEETDRLATTFEAFFDTEWLRSLEPIELFNKLGIRHGRSIDFDTTLDAQDRLLSPGERTIAAMPLTELVHPSQMIHQYTMFRRRPNAAQPCFSMPMIPFFAYLSGTESAIERATSMLEGGTREHLDMFGDGTWINLSLLTVDNVDWSLKQMVQALLALRIEPDPAIHRYGTALYRAVGAAESLVWRGDFTDAQREWIERSAPVPA